MHARELVELAQIVSAQGPVLIRNGQRLSPSAIQQYWAASKCRNDRWSCSLKAFRDSAQRLSPDALHADWPRLRGLLEEILLGEVLTRVWTAVVAACDRQQGTQEAEPIARSVMLGHMEARHRLLMLLVRGPGIEAEAAVKLNHLRRRTERWTDLLVGYLDGLVEVGEFAIDPERARDFAQDLCYQREGRGGQQAWALLRAALHGAFQQGLAPTSPNADLNAAIASSILACFPAEVFDSTGVFRSLWLTRLSNAADDVQGMVEDLLAPQPGHKATTSGVATQAPATWLRRRR